MSELVEVSSEQDWEERLRAAPGRPPLLQSWRWGEVQSRWGWRCHRLVLTAGPAQVLERPGPASLAYAPRGPLVPAAALAEAGAELLAWGQARRIGAVRIEPDLESDQASPPPGWRPARAMQPQHSSILGLRSDDDELLASFHPKTRYNLRLAQRRGLEALVDRDVPALTRMCAETARREGIALPGARYFEDVLSQFGDDAAVVRVVLGGETLAALLLVQYAGRAHYLFGGSSRAHSRLMPSHLAQWRAIAWSRERGADEYDLWGMPPPDAGDSHPWAGIGRFKRGFHGREIAYMGAWQRILRPVRFVAADRLTEIGRRIRRYIIR